MADPLIATLRFVHITAATLWVGAGVLFAYFIAPTARQAGPAGGQFMSALLLRTRFLWFIPTLAIITVVAGAWLYLELGYAGPPEGRAEIALNLGVLGGLVAAGIALFVNLPAARRMRDIAAEAASKGGPPNEAQMAEVGKLQGRLHKANQVWVVFIGIALFGMSTFQFV